MLLSAHRRNFSNSYLLSVGHRARVLRTWTNQRRHKSIDSTAGTVDNRFNILFLGRDEFSCLVLRELHRARDLWKQIVVVTQPDTRTGRRGEDVSISPLKELSLELSHPVHHIPASKSDFKTWVPPPPFKTSTPPLPSDFLLVTASFGRILRSSTLGLFQRGRKLNVHPSLLPKYRGAAPIQWIILREEEEDETGVCVIEMLGRNEGEGVDAGELWGFERMAMPTNPDFKALRDSLGVKGGQLLVSTLRDMLNGKAISQPQPPGDRTPAPRITPNDALIDFQAMSASRIFRRHRAMGHQKPLWTHYLASWSPAGLLSPETVAETWNTIQLFDVSLPLAEDTHHCDISTSIPGSFTYSKQARALLVRCADGSVVCVRKVKPASGKEMSAEAFWSGVKTKVCRAEKKRNGSEVPDGLMVFGMIAKDSQ